MLHDQTNETVDVVRNKSINDGINYTKHRSTSAITSRYDGSAASITDGVTMDNENTGNTSNVIYNISGLGNPRNAKVKLNLNSDKTRKNGTQTKLHMVNHHIHPHANEMDGYTKFYGGSTDNTSKHKVAETPVKKTVEKMDEYRKNFWLADFQWWRKSVTGDLTVVDKAEWDSPGTGNVENIDSLVKWEKVSSAGVTYETRVTPPDKKNMEVSIYNELKTERDDLLNKLGVMVDNELKKLALQSAAELEPRTGGTFQSYGKVWVPDRASLKDGYGGAIGDLKVTGYDKISGQNPMNAMKDEPVSLPVGRIKDIELRLK